MTPTQRNIRSGMALSAAVTLWLGTCGCAVLLVGAGAAGGYALSKDSVRDHYDLPAAAVFDQALRVMKELGSVELKDPDRGLIKGTVEGAEVTITVKRLTKRTVELKVRARELLQLVPEIQIAQRVYDAIDDRLE